MTRHVSTAKGNTATAHSGQSASLFRWDCTAGWYSWPWWTCLHGGVLHQWLVLHSGTTFAGCTRCCCSCMRPSSVVFCPHRRPWLASCTFNAFLSKPPCVPSTLLCPLCDKGRAIPTVFKASVAGPSNTPQTAGGELTCSVMNGIMAFSVVLFCRLPCRWLNFQSCHSIPTKYPC